MISEEDKIKIEKIVRKQKLDMLRKQIKELEEDLEEFDNYE